MDERLQVWKKMMYILVYNGRYPLEIQRFLWEMNEHNPFIDDCIFTDLPRKHDDVHCKFSLPEGMDLFHSLYKTGRSLGNT